MKSWNSNRLKDKEWKHRYNINSDHMISMYFFERSVATLTITTMHTQFRECLMRILGAPIAPNSFCQIVAPGPPKNFLACSNVGISWIIGYWSASPGGLLWFLKFPVVLLFLPICSIYGHVSTLCGQKVRGCFCSEWTIGASSKNPCQRSMFFFFAGLLWSA